MSDIDKLQDIVKIAKEKMELKCKIFYYDIYVKMDNAICLTYDLYGFDTGEVIASYKYNCKNIHDIKKDLDKITEDVIKESTDFYINVIQRKNCWKLESEKIVLLLDIMGFKNLVKDEFLEKIYLKLYKIFARFQNLDKGYTLKDKVWVELFSDTIIVIIDDSSEASVFMLNLFVSEIMRDALELGILFRGAIAKGKVIVDKKHHICFGQPIIDAYLLEEEQSWFGISCHPSAESIFINNIDKLDVTEADGDKYSLPLFTYYNVPLKNEAKKLLVCAWFNYPGISVKEVISNINILKENAPSKVYNYYDETLRFINYAIIQQ